MIDDMLVGPGLNFDFNAYFARIEYSGDRQPTAGTLRDLHVAHATHITFENLDVMLRQPIRLDLESLEQKLIGNRRGGYCFEQNLLFAAVLERLGFAVTLLQARVRCRAQRVLPRTHVALLVELAGDRWLSDLGFGSCGLVAALPLVVGE